MSGEAEHFTLAYTNRDDGIHLRCDRCPDYDEILDYWPSLKFAADRARAHEQAAHPTGEPS